MKKNIIALSMLLASFAYGQEYKTGDAELDANLKKVQTEAKADLGAFKREIASRYKVAAEKVENCFKAGMDAADAVMAFEIAGITKKPIEDVITVYKTDKSKGWGAMAKELGIKPGSAEFHALKGKTKGGDAKKGSGDSKEKPGKGNSQGKPNGNGKPAGKGNGKK